MLDVDFTYLYVFSFFKVCFSPDTRLECIVFKSRISPHPFEVFHHGLLKEPHLIKDLSLDKYCLARLGLLLDNLGDFDESLLAQFNILLVHC